MADHNQIAGGVIEVPTRQGVVKIAGQVSNRTKIRFENFLENRARASVYASREGATLEQYQENAALVQRNIDTGVYSWGEQVWRDSYKTLPGLLRITVLLAEQAGCKLTEEQARDAIIELSWVAKMPKGYQGKEGPVDEVQQAVLFDTEEQAKVHGEPEAINTSLLGEAVKQAIKASPNFQLPPVRERGA